MKGLSGNIEALRKLRVWHWTQAVKAREQAEGIEKRVSSSVFDREANPAFERAASEFHARANEHIRFVQVLNDFFPVTDRVV